MNSYGQILSEGFEESATTAITGGTGMPANYSTGSYILTSGTWTFKDAKRSTVKFSSGNAACQLNSSTGANIVSPVIASGGIGTINFYASVSTVTQNGTALQVATSTDGINFTPVTGSPFTLTTTATQYSVMINDTSSNLRVRFYRTGSYVYLDDISFTIVSAPAPTITSLSPSSAVYGSGTQTVTINGTNFINGITTATYKGNAKIVTYLSSTQITIPLLAGDVNTVGTFPVVVNNRGNSATASASFTVVKANQTITFGALPAKNTADTLFDAGATTSSKLAVTYTSSNASVATITADGLVNITGIGTSVITASQSGNASYNAATPVSQTLTVTQGPVLIAGWDFQTKTNGGMQIDSLPATQKLYVANFGKGNIYLDGTNGSSAWVVTGAIATTEVNAFIGTTINAGSGFAGSGTYGSLALVSGTGNGTYSANGKSLVVKFSMSGRKNLLVSYATQGTSSSFTSQKWEYSKDGTTWTNIQTINSIPASFATDTLTTITGLDNASAAYLKLTVTGATANGANNRLDNIRLTALSAPVITSQPVNASAYCAGTAGTSNFTVEASGYPAPSYKWQYSKNNITFKNVADNTPQGFTFTNANTATLTVTSSASATTDSSYYRAVATNSVDSVFSNSALLTNGQPVAAVVISPKNVCNGGTVTITITGTPNAIVDFRVDIEGIPGTPQSGTLNSSGTYITTAIITSTNPVFYNIVITRVINPSTGCINNANSSDKGNIYPLPKPTFSVAPSGSVCLNTSIIYTAPPNNNPYTWTVSGTINIDYSITGGGLGANSNSVALKWLTASSKTVTVNYTNNNGCTGANPAKSVVTVTTPPTANVGDYNTILCSGSKADIQVAGTPGATVNYSTSDGTNGTLLIGSDGTYIFHSNAITAIGTSSTYTFTLTGVTSTGGCNGSTISPNSASIQVYSYPQAGVISGGGAYIAVGSTAMLSDNTAGGAWSSDNISIASVTKSGVVKGEAPGTDTIRYTVTNPAEMGSCASSVAAPVYIYDPLTADYITASDGDFSDNRNWKLNGGNNNTYINAAAPPASTNSVIIKNKIILDADYTVGAGKTFLLNTTIANDTFIVAPGRVFTVNGTANFNFKPVLLRSFKDSTAQIGGTAVIGNATAVTAERYIALNTLNGSRTGRAWRLLTSPISDVTINQAWQEGLVSTNNPPTTGTAGYGTNITGYKQGDANTATSHGYDFWSAIAYAYSSIRNYTVISSVASWADVPGGIKGMKISAYPAYLLFVRGDRSKLSPPDAGTTTLRATGLLRQADTTYNVYSPSSQGYSLIGNPYAATLDFDKILNANSNLIKPQYWRWDAANGTYGGYTLVQKSGSGYFTVPALLTSSGNTSTTAQYIESGQGFFVEPATGNGGMLSITAAHKVTSAVTVSPFRILPPAAAPARLFVNLNLYSAVDSSSALADGVMAAFDDAGNGSSDVAKPYNLNENLGLDKDTGILTVLAHPALITITDTLHLRLWNITPRSYQIQVKAENWQAAGLQAYLLDSYLHTTTPLSLSGDVSTVTFTVSSDAASAGQHRFSIVFSPTVLPVTITKVTATKKGDGSVNIDWQVAGETGIKEYTVERSFNGHDFTAIASVAAGAPSGSYSLTDRSPGNADNYYRIRILSAGGSVSYSAIVKLSFSAAGGKTLITLFPNPIQEGATAYLKAENLAAGVYHTALYTASGQRVQVSIIAHSGGSAVISYALPRMMAQGTYTLRIFSSDDKQIAALPVVVVKK